MKEIGFSKRFMEKFGDVVLERKSAWNKIQDIWYRIDWRNTKLVNLQKWFAETVQDCQDDKAFMEQVEKFKNIVNPDKRVVEIIKWINKNITYYKDDVVWKVTEMWQEPLLTFQERTGDCEDMHLLAMSFCYWTRMPSFQYNLACGNVKGGGHAWLQYRSWSNALIYNMDACYYPDFTSLDKRDAYKHNLYLSEWFCFNSEKSWKTIKNPNKVF